jgi:hypothetical protein
MMTTPKEKAILDEGTLNQRHRLLTVVKTPEGTPYAKWAKLGLTAIKMDKHLYEVRMEVASGNRELYASELEWKKSIKRQMALSLAEVLVEDIDFTKLDKPETDSELVMGHLFVLPMKLVDDIVKTSNLGS